MNNPDSLSLPSRFDLAGKRAVITGGSSGIGLATARLFQKHGAQVVITANEEASLENGLRQLAPGAQGYVMRAEQLSDIASIASALAGTSVDIIVPNAGIAPATVLGQTNEEAVFDLVFNVNVKGVYFTVTHLLPHMPDGGSIVLVCSATHELGRKGRALYAASKAAVRSLTRSLAAELLERKIRVNAVSPGPVMTGIQPLYGRTAAQQEIILAEMVPMKRVGTAEEVAQAILTLAGPSLSYTTGAELAVDGGWSQL